MDIMGDTMRLGSNRAKPDREVSTMGSFFFRVPGFSFPFSCFSPLLGFPFSARLLGRQGRLLRVPHFVP